MFSAVFFTDPRYESRLPLLKSLSIYVPRDERFSYLKLSDVVAYGLKSVFQFLRPEFEAQFDSTPSEFDSLEDILKLYEGGIKLPDFPFLESIRREIPIPMLKEIFRTDGERPFHFPMPQVIKGMIQFLSSCFLFRIDTSMDTDSQIEQRTFEKDFLHFQEFFGEKSPNYI